MGDHRLQSSHPGPPLTCGQSPGRLQQRPANSPGRVAWLEPVPCTKGCRFGPGRVHTGGSGSVSLPLAPKSNISSGEDFKRATK